MVDSLTHHAHVSETAASSSFTIPVILYVLAIVFIQTLLHGFHPSRAAGFACAVVVTAVATFTGQAVFVTGLALAALVALMLVITARTPSG